MAATQPIKYLNNSKGVIHVTLINLVVWFISMLIASPMVLGLNNVRDRDPKSCRFYNADFIIYSSTGSFCIPLVFMTYLYSRIYQVIRRRGKLTYQRHHKYPDGSAKRPSTLNANTNSAEDDNRLMVGGNDEKDKIDDKKENLAKSNLAISPPEFAPTNADSGHPPSFYQTFDDTTVREELIPKLDNQQNTLGVDLAEFNRRTSESYHPNAMLFSNELAKEYDTCPTSNGSPGEESRNMTRRSSSWVSNVKPMMESLNRPWSRASQDMGAQKKQRISMNSSSSDSVDSSSDSPQEAVVAADVSTYYANVGGMVLMKIQQRQKEALANGSAAAKHRRQASISNLLHKRKMSRKAYKFAKKEKKATKTLAIVLGKLASFFICNK